MTMFDPDLLPESTDPKGSVRYNCTIIHEQIYGDDSVLYYDDIENNNRFIIEDSSPEYSGYEVHIFQGVVLKEPSGYSWWRSIKQGG